MQSIILFYNCFFHRDQNNGREKKGRSGESRGRAPGRTRAMRNNDVAVSAVTSAIAFYCVCSAGMLIVNKLAISHVPLPGLVTVCHSTTSLSFVSLSLACPILLLPYLNALRSEWYETHLADPLPPASLVQACQFITASSIVYSLKLLGDRTRLCPQHTLHSPPRLCR